MPRKGHLLSIAVPACSGLFVSACQPADTPLADDAPEKGETSPVAEAPEPAKSKDADSAVMRSHGESGAARDSSTTASEPDAGVVSDAADLAGDAERAIDARPDQRCQANVALPQRTDYAQPGPFAVATMEIRFEDSSRPIVASATHPAAPSRTLLTTIYYPASGPAPLFGQAPIAPAGPFPMLMYSHGYSSSRSEGVPLANRAASHGYIVVAPEFPLTNILANGGNPDVTDAANQPGDVSFVIDQVLALSRDKSHLLANAVDEARIGAVGLSLGGLTTLLVSFHPRFHDARIKATVPIAALSAFFAEGFYHTRALPMLLIHGDMDAFIDYEHNARRAFTRATPNARLLTVQKGTHAAFGAQLDPALVSILNGLLGASNADGTNPDGLGCGAVGGTLSMTGPEFLQALGGPSDFIVPDDTELRPCQGTEYTQPAIDAQAQEEIAVSGAVSFFDAHLAKSPELRQDGCRYLLHELPKRPAAKLE